MEGLLCARQALLWHCPLGKKEAHRESSQQQQGQLGAYLTAGPWPGQCPPAYPQEVAVSFHSDTCGAQA